MKTLILMPILFAGLVIASTSPAAEHLWRWVDEDGVLTFSNNKPPASAQDATLIYSRYADDYRQMKTGAQDTSRQPPEASLAPWRADPRSHPGDDGDYTVAENQTPFDEFHAAGEDDCCHPYVDADASDRFYTPYSAYAYSRRNYKGSWRYAKRLYAERPHYRHHHHRHHHKRYPYGYRRYDRHYYHGPYRYHSRVPRYHHYGKKRSYGRYYGKKRSYRSHYGKKRYYRGYYGKKYHRGGYYGKRRASTYHGGRKYRGGKTRLGHAGYRGRSSHRMRR